MIKEILVDLVLAVCGASLLGCANMTFQKDHTVVVVSSQMNVLKKIVALRDRDSVKAKIGSDPLLNEQEQVLKSGLLSVIESQEAQLKLLHDNRMNRGANVY